MTLVFLLFAQQRLSTLSLHSGNGREALRKHVDKDDVTKRDAIDSLSREHRRLQGEDEDAHAGTGGKPLPVSLESRNRRADNATDVMDGD